MKRSEVLKKMRETKAGPVARALRRRAATPKHQPAKPTGDTIKVLISLPVSLNRQLDRNASKHGISKSALVRNLIVKNRDRVKRLS